MKKIIIISIIGLILISYASLSLSQSIFQINIYGIKGDPLKNVQNRLNIENEIKLFFENAPSEIKNALKPYGYFKSSVQSSLTKRNQVWIANFYISPGPRMKITQMDLKLYGEGLKDKEFTNFIAHFPIQSNQYLSIATYNEAKQKLFAIAHSRGYFNAQMTKNVVYINLKTYTAQVIIHFDTGERYRFGRILFNPNPLSNNLLNRFAPFSYNDFYDAEKVQQFQENLGKSTYLKSVLVVPKIEQPENHSIPIMVKVKPRPRQQFNIGAGYGTDTGLSGMLGYEIRYLNPEGHKLNTQLQASQVDNSLEVNYIIPGKNPITDQYYFSAAIKHIDEKLGKSQVEKISVSDVHSIKSWQQTIGLTLQQEHYFVGGSNYQTQISAIPSINWMKTTSDDPLRPTRGMLTDLTLRGSPNIFGNTPFLQAHGRIKLLYPPTLNSRILLRAELGYTAIDDIDNLPLSLQLLAGGSQSIRGYSYHS